MEIKKVKLRINGKIYELEIKSYETLLESLLRLGIISNLGSWCERGECGNCVVLIDGRPINSCLTLTMEVNRKDILTLLKGGK